jgi:aspartyl-tRNA(Asn)/glutamyl-tRNA(Gln) amidotransferase subunit B
MRTEYETVIGLEVHVQLSTDTKIFCGCSTRFGAEPNTQVCPVCLGMPGALPVLNKKAFEHSVKIACALNCDIQKILKFDRKNYYYPDLPKAYQISQFDMPLAYQGNLVITDENGRQKSIGITRAHMEEDAGKLIHVSGKSCSYVDLNRTGTPLLEIVSEPDMRSPEEAYRYLTKLKRVIKYLDVSDCNMEEGSLRCDANISMRGRGETELGCKVEIKNLNSFKAVRDALLYEQRRQEELLDEGWNISMETRLWDDNKQITLAMRSKEEAQDYRYFPEPDLVPFEVSPELIRKIKSSMPELPDKRRHRYETAYDLDEKDLDFLVSEKYYGDLFERVAAQYPQPKTICNWIRGDILMNANERGTDVKGLSLNPLHIADLIKLTNEGVISGLVAKEVLRQNIDTGKDPAVIVKQKGLEQVSDKGELDLIIEDVINSNKKSVDDFKNGKDNAISFLVGQVMKISRGKANPKLANELLRAKLGE